MYIKICYIIFFKVRTTLISLQTGNRQKTCFDLDLFYKSGFIN